MATKVSNAKLEVKKFDWKNNFRLYHLKIKELILKEGLYKVLRKKSLEKTNNEWDDINFDSCQYKFHRSCR